MLHMSIQIVSVDAVAAVLMHRMKRLALHETRTCQGSWLTQTRIKQGLASHSCRVKVHTGIRCTLKAHVVAVHDKQSRAGRL